MAVPDGARTARYNFVLYQEGPPMLDTSFAVNLPAEPAPFAEAGEAAMNQMLDDLRTTYPDADIQASRRYDCIADGDPWPPTA
jgi:hypothetical protein